MREALGWSKQSLSAPVERGAQTSYSDLIRQRLARVNARSQATADGAGLRERSSAGVAASVLWRSSEMRST